MIERLQPTIPMEIFSLSSDDADLTYHMRCEELWAEVLDEMLDTDYNSRSHQNVGTYDRGCRGPLCRKALREHPRRRSPDSSQMLLREERVYDPVLEYFHTIIKHRVRNAQQAILKELKEQSA